MRSLLRAMLAITLLLGSGVADWAPKAEAHDCCCGSVPAGLEDSCPCPKPDSNRGPQRSTCPERQVLVAAQAARQVGQGQRRTEPRPEPAHGSPVRATDLSQAGFEPQSRGRAPDLGRHLARLNTFRI